MLSLVAALSDTPSVFSGQNGIVWLCFIHYTSCKQHAMAQICSVVTSRYKANRCEISLCYTL